MFKREGSLVVAKFTDGDILNNLKQLMEELRSQSAIILGGIGMLEHARIGYFDGTQYIEETLEEPVELISLQGNIGMHENDYVIHAHVGLAGSNHSLKGGHLFAGTVKVVNEITLYILTDIHIERIKQGTLLMMDLSTPF